MIVTKYRNNIFILGQLTFTLGRFKLFFRTNVKKVWSPVEADSFYAPTKQPTNPFPII